MRDIPGGGVLFERFLPWSYATYWSGTALLALGLAFSVWARVYLGRNWSGTVTVKLDHELIRGGPYARVRHPIYTGLLLAFIGTAIVRAEWRGVLAVLIVFVALWRKLRLEERWMIETFGDQYRRYRERTAALIPFLF
jgi:protein-S-isoprenylcysteine O-methyltransferase Ste14